MDVESRSARQSGHDARGSAGTARLVRPGRESDGFNPQTGVCRMASSHRRGRAALVVLTLALLLPACNDQILYRDRPLFEDPPAGAGEFLGYSAAESKRTVCGNCHIGKQRQWEQTAHAGAWTTLQGTGSTEPACQGCHTVSSRGNLVNQDNVGWVATRNARYQDVQCESCHGPGLTHVLNPDATGTKPLAPLAVGTDLSMGCGQCHSGVHRPFAEEWSNSLHARVVASRSRNPACAECHDATAILEGWGVKATFLEQAGEGELLAVTCGVCHDPHDARHPGQLRFAITEPVVERNLCMKCHHKRGEPDPTTFRGPHSPEGPLLLGTGGWWPPNFQYPQGSIVGSHGSEANPRLCAGCHVIDHEVRDALTGNFVFRATGHSFAAIPCVNSEGVPTGQRNCELTERSFRSCTQCHGSEVASRSALLVARTRIDRLIAEIQPLIARIPASEFDHTDNRYTTGEGARFNQQLAQRPGSVVHNPFLIEALLIASIRQIEIDYGIRASASLSLAPELMPR
jgi:predicted CXXCH cytochrome family protein